MSDYGSLYLIESTYNVDRDATELAFGYIAKEKDVEGRSMKLRVIVNIKGGRKGHETVLDEGIKKARSVLRSASKSSYKED